jgi:selenocysteine lyase/cysteine desulfurase
MSYILTPNGRKPMISESVELDETVDLELDMDHFVEYVMENFPELTEKYIQENYEQVDEISTGLAVRAAVKRQTNAWNDANHRGTDRLKPDLAKKVTKSKRLIKARFGQKGLNVVSKIANKKIGVDDDHQSKISRKAPSK